MFLPNPAILAAGPGGPTGQQVFTANGSFVVPAGVTKISVVAVGRSGLPDAVAYGGPGGGATAWTNDIAVTPGETLLVRFNELFATRLLRSTTTLIAAGNGLVASSDGQGGLGGTVIMGQGGGPGGSGGAGDDGAGLLRGGGGGAGGYNGSGGDGASNGLGVGSAGSGGGGSGGGPDSGNGGSGGGVGLLGQGPSGAATAGKGNPGSGGIGPNYGGGNGADGAGIGALRIIWGDDRAFPSTNTGDIGA